MTFDADQYKTTTRQQWEDYAGGWNDWAPLLETLARRSHRTHARPRRGTGGEPGARRGSRRRRPEHRRCSTSGGPDGTVLATDLSPTILEHAAQAAKVAGVENVSTRELDGEELHQLPGESFDAAISRVGLIYFPNRHQALTGIHHALRDGGRFATVTYSTAATNGFFALPVSIIRERAQLPAPAAGQPGPFSLADPEILQRDLTRAGFHDVVIEVIDAPVMLPSAADCVRFERESFGALHQMLGSMSAESQASVWDEIEVALSQFDTADGFVGPCELVIAAATR